MKKSALVKRPLTTDARKALSDEIVSLFDIWAQYQLMFAKDPSHIDVMNACAPWFFAVIQRLMIRELIMGISRLTDPVEQAGNQNLVIGTLLEDPLVAEHSGLQYQLTRDLANAVVLAEPIRRHRSKYIAHLDHLTAIEEAGGFIGLEYKTITDALLALETAYNRYGRVLHESFMVFDYPSHGGADILLSSLRGSDRWRKWQKMNPTKAGG